MINAYGYVFGNCGYNIHTRKFFQALNKLHPVCLVPMDPPSNVQQAELDVADMIKRQRAINLSDPAIALNYASQFQKFNGSTLIGYTVFEYTRLSEDWRNLLKQMHQVWTASSWGARILEENGIARETIHVVPEGIDPEIFFPNRQKQNDTVFSIVSVGKWENRKGQRELLRALSDVFPHNVDIILYCAWFNPFIKDFSLEAEIKKLGLRKIHPIKVVRNLPSAHHMAQLYNLADCFVLPTRGEGWGLPMMEAMACGLPVITTGYSAVNDYANEENAYLINVKRLVDASDERFFPNPGEYGQWAEIDYEHLKELLYYVYMHRDEAREKGRRASEEIRKRWTWDEAAKKAMDILEKTAVITPSVSSS